MTGFGNPQVNIYVDDVPASAAFYERLGFRESFRTPPAGEPLHVELRLDDLVLGIASVTSARADHGLDVRTDGRSVEICVWTDDVDTAHDELVAAGAPSLSAPHDWLDGRLRVAWVGDPTGNPVELVHRRRTV